MWAEAFTGCSMGAHAIAGAIHAARGASTDDNLLQEALGTLQGLFRDGTTPGGLPLANWNQETFDQVAATLQSNFHIPRAWFYDPTTDDAAELLGGTVGVLALAFGWSRATTETFARLTGGMGLSAVISANPLLFVVTVASLAKAFDKAHQTGEYAELIDGQFQGGMGAGATAAAATFVSAAGGHAGTALLAGVAAGVLAHMVAKYVIVASIVQFMAEKMLAIAGEVEEFAASVSAWRPGLRS